jgi:hypothetical protein
VLHQRHPATRPLVAEILSCEAWYGDDKPSWKGAPSSDQATCSRLSYVKRLRRFADQFPPATALASTLEACQPYHRCLSGACPECCRAFQRWLVLSTKRLILGSHSTGELVTASIVFPNGRAPVNSITSLDTLNSKRAVTRAVENSSHVDWMVGGIDLSLNDDTQKNSGIAWQIQLYGIAMVKDPSEISSLLKTKFPRSKWVMRPVQMKVCDGTRKAISYAFKTEFVQRTAYYGTATSNGQSRQCWKTRKVSLRPADHVRALLWLDSIGFAHRLYLRGVRMTRNHHEVVLAKVRKLE